MTEQAGDSIPQLHHRINTALTQPSAGVLPDFYPWCSGSREEGKSLINVEELTCYRQTGGAAGNGPQVVDSSDALIGSLVGLVVLGVDHVGEEQRAVWENVPPLI